MQIGAELLIPAGQTVLVAGLIWRAMRQAAQIATLEARQLQQAEQLRELEANKQETQLALLIADVGRIQDEIGRDHNSGIRGRLHMLPNTLLQMSQNISELQRTLQDFKQK